MFIVGRVTFTSHDDLQLLALLAALGVMLVAAAMRRLPVAIPLVCGGLILGFVPGLPHLQLPPDLVLVAILPPLLYSSAFFTGLRDLRQNLRPISLLAVGLVAATTCCVAAASHAAVSGLSWGSAFTLGAIVSPTDAIAATEVARRVRRASPHRLDHRRREPRQRRDGARPLQVRRRGGRRGNLLTLERVVASRRERGRRDRCRPRSRVRRAADSAPCRRSADGGLDRSPFRLSRVPARGGARRLGRARRGDDRRLHGLVHAAADERRDTALGQCVLGDPRVPDQRDPLRARRPAAARDRRPVDT